MTTDAHTLAARLSAWFERRLADTCPPPCRSVQLYGLEVIDETGIDTDAPDAVRTVFVDEAPDEATLLASRRAHRAFDFDAVAVVRQVWTTSGGAPRPASYPARSRSVRVDVVAIRP